MLVKLCRHHVLRTAVVAAAICCSRASPLLSIHVPLYNPRLSPSSNDLKGVLWAARQPHAPALSVAICAKWDFQRQSDVCNATENIAAAQLLRQAGVQVYHYIPAQRLPVEGRAVCCNSLENITRFVSTALSRPNASNDGIYFDLAADDMTKATRLPFFSQLYQVAKHSLPERQLMINPSVPQFMKQHLEMEPQLRVNALESTLDNLRTQTPAMHSFNWSQFDRSRFAAVVESVSSADEGNALDLLEALGYGTVFVEPDAQDYWNLPPYWQSFVLRVTL